MKKSKRFILNIIILTITTFLLKSIAIYFNIYISNKIGAEGIGIFQLIFSIYTFFITLAMSGINLATTRIVAEELALNSHLGIRLALKRCLNYSMFFGLSASFILFWGAEYITTHWLHSKISISCIYLLCTSLPFMAVSSVLNGYFTAVRRVIKSSSAQIFEQFVKIFATVYLLYVFAPKGLDYACYALILGGAISEILSFIYLYFLYLLDKRRYTNNYLVKDNIKSRMFKIALPVAFSSYIRSALNTFKQIIIPIRLEKAGLSCDIAMAQYGLVRGMVMPVIMFPQTILSAFSGLIIPEIAENAVRNNTKSTRYIVSRIFKITFIFSIFVSGILFSYSDELSMAIYKNLDSSIFIKLLSPLILIMYLDDIVDALLKGLNKQVDVVKINILDTIISIILLYSLLPIYNIYGYIIVIFASEILNGSLSIYRLIKTITLELNFIKWIILPTISITISIFITKLIIVPNLIINILISVFLYLLILYILKVINISDFKI